MSVLKCTDVSFSFGNRTILENASFVMQKGEHIGLVGLNGEGKSTFIKMITGSLTPDQGKIEWCKRITTGYLDQYSSLTKGKTIREVLREAFQHMYDLEAEMNELYEKMCDCTEEEMNEYLEDTGEIQSELEISGFYQLDAKIEEVANGLGLGEIGLDHDVSNLSGGQRSKVLLTKLLLAKPTILILDEPTNFLDEEQVSWLRNYLANYENAFLLVSHDEAFINSVINVVYHMEDGVLTRYSGDYYSFRDMYELKKRQQNIAYEKQQKEIAHLKEFIAKNKARVATTDLAKSRQRILDKMEIIDKAKEQIKPTFKFKECGASGKFVMSANDLVIGYNEPLSKKLNFVIERGQKVAIKGANGIGKSTLLKTLLGIIPPLSGECKLDYNIHYGYFAQEEDYSRNTAHEEIWQEYPMMTNAEVRGALAACGLTKEKIESLMVVLSGGEAAKVRLCKIMLKECNTLVLDEPTNHLDYLAKESLKDALKAFKGTIVLVCHEAEFYSDIVTDVLDAEKWTTKIL
ncbi:MAG: ABC-F family ATP-binding cassette domain-containing protein [Erysipelotrichaceae bacterium]|nr:ABC-F family ATP-binding cassette domain-containing protein [Erysipelotrichaceae bacterium]